MLLACAASFLYLISLINTQGSLPPVVAFSLWVLSLLIVALAFYATEEALWLLVVTAFVPFEFKATIWRTASLTPIDSFFLAAVLAYVVRKGPILAIKTVLRALGTLDAWIWCLFFLYTALIAWVVRGHYREVLRWVAFLFFYTVAVEAVPDEDRTAFLQRLFFLLTVLGQRRRTFKPDPIFSLRTRLRGRDRLLSTTQSGCGFSLTLFAGGMGLCRRTIWTISMAALGGLWFSLPRIHRDLFARSMDGSGIGMLGHLRHTPHVASRPHPASLADCLPGHSVHG